MLMQCEKNFQRQGLKLNTPIFVEPARSARVMSSPVDMKLKTPHPSRFRRAFTLIELLIVIAIIALLAAFLVPAVSKALRKGYQSQCMSNLKQSATALQVYMDDNEQWLPPGKGAASGLFTGQGAAYDNNATGELVYYTAKYLGLPSPSANQQIASTFICPGAKRYSSAGVTDATRTDYALTPISSNINFQPFGNASPALPPHAMAEITDPSTIWSISDTDQLATGPGPSWYATLPPAPVHGLTRNSAYFDNHVGQRSVGPPGTM